MSEPENYVKKEEPRVSIKQRRKKSIGGTLGTLFAENQSMLMLFAVIVAALAVILTGIIALHMPVVPVCLIVLLETGIACCLHDNIQAGKPKDLAACDRYDRSDHSRGSHRSHCFYGAVCGRIFGRDFMPALCERLRDEYGNGLLLWGDF